MKARWTIWFLCFASIFVFFGCKAQGTGQSLDNFDVSRRVVIDTDAGGDDAMAILMAIKAPNIQIHGITTMAGNVSLDQAVKNVLTTVEAAGAVDIPVYCGAHQSLDGQDRICFSVYGKDGLGDADLAHPQGTVARGDAISFILETVKQYPGEMELLCLGPMTNVAMAIEQDPQTMAKVKRIWSMSTAGFGQGNATPVAEFNVYVDTLAYQVVLESGIPMTIVGLDLCENESVMLDEGKLQALIGGSGLEQFAGKALSGLMRYYQSAGREFAPLCDPLAAYAMIYADAILESRDCAAVCITDSGPAYGQVILYRSDRAYDTMPVFDAYPVRVISQMNDGACWERIRNLLSR